MIHQRQLQRNVKQWIVASSLSRNRLWEDLLTLTELGRVDFLWVDSNMLTANGRLLLLKHRCHFIVSTWKWSTQSGKRNFSHIIGVSGQMLSFPEVIYCFSLCIFYLFFYSYHRRKKILKHTFKKKTDSKI